MKSCLFFLQGLVVFLLASIPLQVSAQNVVFMEPVEGNEQQGLPAYRLITDETRLKSYTQWIQNDAARWAIDLYTRAATIAGNASENAAYYIALVPGGNHADVGFQLINGSSNQSFPNRTFIKLDADPVIFKATLFHETGHMVLAVLNGGKKIPQKGIASIPHTTAALTDRGTAFDEGFAIHLETLAAHLSKDPDIRSRYTHDDYQFGVPKALGEYHRIAGDLLSYAQSATRYAEVRENHFAFAPAFKGPDYFRVQLEKSRDFAELRDANQLLQSEGFYATFFFAQLIRGKHDSLDAAVSDRQTKMLEVLFSVFHSENTDAESPFLLSFLEHYLKKYPEEGKQVLDVFLDLTHGVFVDRDAAELWRKHYIASLHLDLAEKENKAIEGARERWRKAVLADSKILYSLLGPQIAVEVPEISVLLVAFKEGAPLAFDVNTVEEGIIRMIPGIDDPQVASWLAQRRTRSFANFEDFRARSGLIANVLRHIQVASFAESNS